MLGLVVVATAAGAFVAHDVYHQTAATIPPPSSSTTTAPSTTTSAQSVNSTTVALTADARSSSQGKQIQQALQTYFNAINQRDYAMWLSVVTEAQAAEKSESDFHRSYESTKDTDITVLRIETAPSGLSVLVTFRSTQNVEDAPQAAQFPCVQWQVVWPMVRQNGGYKLDTGVTLNSPQLQQCA